MAVITTICPCGAKIRHNDETVPNRCVCCKKKFVSADDVVIIEGKNPPIIVKVDTVGAIGEVNN